MIKYTFTNYSFIYCNTVKVFSIDLLRGPIMDEKLKLKIPQGRLIGKLYPSDYDNQKYFSFLGIPYAKPPLGSLRFMPPERWEKWTGTKKATAPGSDCVHLFGLESELVQGDEDCLYLNVYTPEAPCDIETKKTLKPVIVLIHCGGHFWGSGSAEFFGAPDFMIHQDVIWVAFNYRLHILGFLNLELPNCSGNMGLKDQVMALRWVKENIQYFGGDPDNITITGSSSGATDVHLHLLSPMSKGLFHKAIIQSGWSLNPIWGFQTDHLQRAKQVAEKLGYFDESEEINRKRLFRFLKNMSSQKLLQAVIDCLAETKTSFNTRPHHSMFHPTIEAFSEGAFLSTNPRNLIFSLNAPAIPVIWGITVLEGGIAFLTRPLKATLTEIIRDNLWLYNLDPSIIKIIAEKVKKFYGLQENLTSGHILQLTNLYTDIWFMEWKPYLDFISTRPDAQPVFTYLFSFSGRFNYQRKYILKKVEELPDYPSHGDDASYFTYLKALNRTLNASGAVEGREKKVVYNMSKLFSNFVRTGTPNEPQQMNINWKAHTAVDPHYLDFGESLKVKKGIIFEKRVKFWNNLLPFIKNCDKAGPEKIAILVKEIENLNM